MKACRLFAAALAASVFPALADPIAFLSNLKGKVAIDGSPRPMLLAELSRGQKITLGRDATASVMYIATGKEYLLRGPAEYQLKDAEITGPTPMPPMVRNTEWRPNGKVVVQVAQSSAASVRMRSVAQPREAPVLEYPTEGRIATLQPTLRWRAADPKQAGEVTLHAVGEDKPVHVGKAAGSSYRLPLRLKPDAEYAWSYARAGNEVGSGRFRTMPGDALQQIEQRRPSARADFSDRLLFALLLQELGAVQEAREVFRALAAERSDLPELAGLAR